MRTAATSAWNVRMMARSGEPSDGERGGRRVIENEILGCAGWSGTTNTRGYNRDINDDEWKSGDLLS